MCSKIVFLHDLVIDYQNFFFKEQFQIREILHASHLIAFFSIFGQRLELLYYTNLNILFLFLNFFKILICFSQFFSKHINIYIYLIYFDISPHVDYLHILYLNYGHTLCIDSKRIYVFKKFKFFLKSDGWPMMYNI